MAAWLHRAAGADGLTAEGRARVCASAAAICLEGVRYSLPRGTEVAYGRTVMRRKAAFFTAVAADGLR